MTEIRSAIAAQIDNIYYCQCFPEVKLYSKRPLWDGDGQARFAFLDGPLFVKPFRESVR